MKILCDVQGCRHDGTVRWWLPISVTITTASGGRLALEPDERLVRLCDGHAEEAQRGVTPEMYPDE